MKRDPCSEGPDQFVAKFDPTLTSLIFSTLIGTAGRNAASDLVLGPDGSIFGIARGSVESNDSRAVHSTTPFLPLQLLSWTALAFLIL